MVSVTASAVATSTSQLELSPREASVLQLASDGYTNRRIGTVLGLHEDSVKYCLRQTGKKFGKFNREHIVMAALTAGLIQPPHVPDSAYKASLTSREMDILNGLRTYSTNKAIGQSLYLSEDTIKTYVRRLLSKLGAVDRTNLLAIAWVVCGLDVPPSHTVKPDNYSLPNGVRFTIPSNAALKYVRTLARGRMSESTAKTLDPNCRLRVELADRLNTRNAAKQVAMLQVAKLITVPPRTETMLISLQTQRVLTILATQDDPAGWLVTHGWRNIDIKYALNEAALVFKSHTQGWLNQSVSLVSQAIAARLIRPFNQLEAWPNPDGQTTSK